MYRKKMASLIMAVKAATKAGDLHPLLADYEPPPPEPKKDLVSLAKEVEATLRPASNPSPSTKSKSGGFKLKREKNGQRSLHDFFVAKKEEGAEEKSGSMDIDEQVDDAAKVEEEETPSSDFEESSSQTKRSKAQIDLEAVSSAGNGSNHQEAVEVEENGEGEGGDGTPPSPSVPSSSQMASTISTKNVSPADLEVTRRLQEKIDQLGQAMREGMDQIKFVQKERAAQRAVTTSRSHPNVSPKSSHGHRPVPRLSADETKERKRKVADDFIQSLWPFMKQARIGSKTAFKMLARELTHKALEREKRRGKAVRAEEVVTRFFAENKRITSDQEAKARLKAFRV